MRFKVNSEDTPAINRTNPLVSFDSIRRIPFKDLRLEHRPLSTSQTAKVFVGTWKSQPVVAKYPLPSSSSGSLLRELHYLRLLAGLKTVSRLVGYSEKGGRPVVVTRYYKGETLGARLDRGPLSSDEFFKTGGLLLSGLASVHHREVIHCDLKPENIFLTHDSRVILLDFGSAWKSEESERVVRLHMTPHYFPPEWAMQDSLQDFFDFTPDKRIDIFQMGIVLFQMLTGRHPFAEDCKTVEEVISKIYRQSLKPDFGHLLSGASAAYRPVVQKALSHDPKNRQPNALALLRDFENVKRSGKP